MSAVAVGGIVGVTVPVALVAYLWLGELAIRRLPPRWARRIRIGIWLAPALALMTVMLVYPLVRTIMLSFQDAAGGGFVGLANYIDTFTQADTLRALRNNILWLVAFTALVTVLGLVVATLGDRVRYEKLVRTVVVLPTAVSFVGAGVIWGFIYAYDPPGLRQTGTLNAIWTGIFPAADPIAWLADERTVNGALIFIGVWMSTGFAAVILSAAIKGVPADTLEAARIDGAAESAVFFRVLLPQISSTVVIVITLMGINALKVFDVIYVLTNGNYGSQVLATAMYFELFAARDVGAASAIAVVLLAATVPVIVINIRSFRRTSG
ncbi:MAG: sugar ABC transporter permease [Bifidobacteriaceae bacterium]|jgi:alpha-glucoside transport system permease protein|nr:sugar ABC transporter permease [Bifidobacteriaceae bacterium]